MKLSKHKFPYRIFGVVILVVAISQNLSCRKEVTHPGYGQTDLEVQMFHDNPDLVQSDTTSAMVKIEGGSYVPTYGRDSDVVYVESFMLDKYPVTNKQFLQFVKLNPQWRRSQVAELFADGNYLRSWKNDTTLGDGMNENAPVTNVGWYAAKAYASSQGKRLPTLDEWEYVANANETLVDARKEEDYTTNILLWYESRSTFRNDVGLMLPNYWGVYDMHSLIWEWVYDFNSVMVSDDGRKGGKDNNNLFCGGASLNANDLRNYAAFMRYAFRGSLKAEYGVQNLGFRCAANVTKC